jgi:VWFA-related protein
MKRVIIVFAACLLLAMPAAQALSGQSQQQAAKKTDEEAVRVETTLVTIPVVAMDRDGKFVPDLRVADFHLYEEGIEQEIAFFHAAEEPITVALLLDVSDSTEFRLDEILKAAIAFTEQLRPDDQVMVVAFDAQVRVLTEPTSDRAALHKAIRSARTGGGTRLYDAVYETLNHYKFKRHRGRRAMIVFTDGVDTGSYLPLIASLRAASEADVFIYPIQFNTVTAISDPINLPSRSRGINSGVSFGGTYRGDYAQADLYLRDLARKTGARLYQADNLSHLNKAFLSIAEELRKQYSLSFYPTAPPQAGQRRRIKVTITRPSVVIRARDSYIYAPSADAKK